MSAPETTTAYTDADVRRMMDALGCYSELDDATQARYCPEHNCGWLSDIDACARAERTLTEVAPAIAARALRDAARDLDRRSGLFKLRPSDKVRRQTHADIAGHLRARADKIEAGR